MLKLWFPQIPTQPVSAASSVATSPARSLQDSSSSTPPHKHRDQLHIPVKVRTNAFQCVCVKEPSCAQTTTAITTSFIFTSQITPLLILQKRRLSWTGTDTPTLSAALPKCPRVRAEEKRVKRDEDERDDPPPPPSPASDASQNRADEASHSQHSEEDTKGKDSKGEETGKLSKYKAGQSSEPSLTWVHVAPILSPRKACPSHEGAAASGNNENQPAAAATPPPSRRGSSATQDSSISSTTPYKHSKNTKKSTRCQSQPVAGQQSESETIKACQGQSQSAHVTLKPLPRVCPAPLET